MAMTEYSSQDFRYRKNMQYDNIKSESNIIRRRKIIKRDSGLGRVCIGCGMTRSMQNKCFCNED